MNNEKPPNKCLECDLTAHSVRDKAKMTCMHDIFRPQMPIVFEGFKCPIDQCPFCKYTLTKKDEGLYYCENCNNNFDKDTKTREYWERISPKVIAKWDIDYPIDSLLRKEYGLSRFSELCLSCVHYQIGHNFSKLDICVQCDCGSNHESKDDWLADIFYTIVHDLEEEVIIEARGQLKMEKKSRYLNQVKRIAKWAEENDYSTIKNRAKKMIKKIIK